jgi:hypothetical protein
MQEDQCVISGAEGQTLNQSMDVPWMFPEKKTRKHRHINTLIKASY